MTLINPDSTHKPAESNNTIVHNEHSSALRKINLYVDWDIKGRHVNAGIVSKLLETFCDCHTIMRIRLGDVRNLEEDVFAFIDDCRSTQKKSLRVDLEVSIADIQESVLNQLFDRRILIRWPVSLSNVLGVSPFTKCLVRRIAEFGIPVIFNIYVNGEIDPQTGISVVEDLLETNLSSGFSFYPSDYQIDKLANVRPSIRIWLELLVSIYKHFPSFDVNFDPLLELLELSLNKNEEEDCPIPRHMGIRFQADGSVKIFRQNPNQAVNWLSAMELESVSPPELLNCFITHIEESFCGQSFLDKDCVFRNICGGTDTACLSKSSSLECETRRFFLETFLAQKEYLLQLWQ